MTGFVDKLKLKEQAEEDLYFARRDRDLLAARRGGSHSSVEGGLPMIVSGGQSGVDRAALDAALALGLPVGGWCPRGRRAEDGVIAPRYPLRETPDRDYEQRTEWNVRDADATLILHRGTLSRGTGLTADLARGAGRPLLIRDLGRPHDQSSVAEWLMRNRVAVLNCAGPRESNAPGIQREAQAYLEVLFALWLGSMRADPG